MQFGNGPHPAPDARGDAGGPVGAARRPLDSHTTPSPSPFRMNGYAGCSRVTGAIPCARASAQLTRPFRLSSHAAIASGTRTAGVTVAGTLPTRERDQLRRGAARQHLVQRVRLAPVDGQAVSLPDRDHPGRGTSSGSAAGPTRPCRGSTFSWRFTRARQREVQQVGREAATSRKVRGAQAAVVSFGASHRAGRRTAPGAARTVDSGANPARVYLAGQTP